MQGWEAMWAGTHLLQGHKLDLDIRALIELIFISVEWRWRGGLGMF